MIFEKIRERLIAKRDSICKTKNDCIALSDAEVNGVTFANFDDAIDIINQVEAEYNNGWIPCSERLPDTYGKYLVTYRINGNLLVDAWLFNGIDFNQTEEVEVIAWQPLPEPYKPKGE